MIRAIIIDDEKHCITTLKHLIQRADVDVDIVASTQSSIDAKELILELQPQLVFLDIEMPVKNGFELLEEFDTLFFETIFTTAYDQYAIKALRVSALDYLLKPIEKTELETAINKYKNKEMHTTKAQLAQVQKITTGKQPDTLALSTIDGLSFIKVDDIMYLEATSCYTSIFMVNGQKFTLSKTLGTFEEVLNPEQFFRAHKSFIINLKCIKQYIRGEGGEVIMQNGSIINISRNKKQELLDLFTKV